MTIWSIDSYDTVWGSYQISRGLDISDSNWNGAIDVDTQIIVSYLLKRFFLWGVISWCLDDWNVTTVMREELLLLKRFWDEECVSCIRDNLKFIPVLLFYVSCMYLSKVEFYTGVIVVWLFDVNKDLVKYGSISCTWSEHLRVGL